MFEHATQQEGESILLDLFEQELTNEKDLTSYIQTFEAEMLVKSVGLTDRYQVRLRYFGGAGHGEVYRESPWCYTAPRAADTWEDETKQECPLEAREIAERAGKVYLRRHAW